MRIKRFAFACVVLFLVALAWNALLHLVLLRGAETTVQGLYRPDLADRMWLSLLVTLSLVVLFTLGYSRFARAPTVGEGVRYGVFFGLLTGVLVDFNQYVLFPIPAWLAVVWFFGGLAEFTVYGVIISKIWPVSGGAG